MNLHDVLNLPQDIAPVPAFSPLQYSLIGFTDTQDIGKWSDLLLHWLPTFDPVAALLIRRIDSEAPTGVPLEAPKQHGLNVLKLSQTSKNRQ